MKIGKSVLSIFVVVIIIVFAAQPVVQAGQGLQIFFTEPDVKGSPKTSATFAAYEYDSCTIDSVDYCQAVFTLRVKTANSRTLNFFTTLTDAYECRDIPAKQLKILDFLNERRVVNAILGCDPAVEVCPDDVFVHIKRDYDGGVVPFDPRAAIADLELVLNGDDPR